MNPQVIKQQIANLRLTHPELVEDEDAWLLSLESETDLDAMLRSIERKRQEAEHMAWAIADNVGELKKRGERFLDRADACRDLMFKLMQAAELKRKELPEATLSIATGQRKVLITDEAAIPDEYCRFKREPDKKKLKDILDNAFGDIPGATLSNAEPMLVVRTK